MAEVVVYYYLVLILETTTPILIKLDSVCACVCLCMFSLALREVSCHVFGHSSSPWRGLHGKDWWSLANNQQRMKAYQQLEEIYKLIIQPQVSLETAEVFAYTLNIPL